jgi:colicin import membrane protein
MNQNWTAYAWRGCLWERFGGYSKAISDYQVVLRSHPNDEYATTRIKACEEAQQSLLTAAATKRAQEEAAKKRDETAAQLSSKKAADEKAALRDSLERQIIVQESRLAEAERKDAENATYNRLEAQKLQQRIDELDAQAATYLRNGEKLKAAAVGAASLSLYQNLTKGTYKKPTGEASRVRELLLNLRLQLHDLK